MNLGYQGNSDKLYIYVIEEFFFLSP